MTNFLVSYRLQPDPIMNILPSDLPITIGFLRPGRTNKSEDARLDPTSLTAWMEASNLVLGV